LQSQRTCGGLRSTTPPLGRARILRDPDMVVTLDRLERVGDKYRFHWKFVGTNSGPGGTGRAVRIGGYEEWTMGADGLITQSLGNYDAAEWDRQLGKIPIAATH
jgi:hypothetical protein